MNKTAKNSAIYLCGTIIMALLGFLSTMLLTRVLSPQVYAMYGLFVNFTTAVSMFISFGYDSAYMRFYYNHGLSQKAYMYKCLKLPIMIYFIFSIVVLEPTHTLITYVFGENLHIYSLIILLVYVFFAFLHRFTQLTARMEECAINYVSSNIISKSGFIVVVFVIFFLYKEVSFDWIIVSFLIATFIAFANNLRIFYKVKEKTTSNEAAVSDKTLLKYGFPLMINSVLVLIVPIAEKLMIRNLAGWEILSIFTAASIFQTVVLLLTNTITNIWNPLVFKYCDDEKKFKPILHEFGLIASVVSVLGLAACILLRRWAVLLLDENYFTVYIIAPSVLFSACFGIVDIIYSVGIKIKQKTSYLIFTPVLQIIFSLLLCMILIPRYELVGAAVSILLSSIISKLYNIIIALKFYNTGSNEWKSFSLCITGLFFSFVSMKYISFENDLIMFFALLLISFLIVNKDFSRLYKQLISFVKR